MLGEALEGIGYALDTPGALLRGAIMGKLGRASGRELLENYGLVGENTDQGWIPDAGDLAGFAAETVLDPLNLVGGGLVKSAATKAAKIKAANALSKKMRAAGAMPEEIVQHLHPSMIDTSYRVTDGAHADLGDAYSRSVGRKLDPESEIANAKSALHGLQPSDIDGSVLKYDPWIGEAIENGWITSEKRPKAFYHGTNRSGIEAADLDPMFAGAATDTGSHGKGVYFTPDPAWASDHAESLGGKGGSVIRAYIDSRNPFQMKTGGFERQVMNAVPGTSIESLVDDVTGPGNATNALMGAGYDATLNPNGNIAVFDKSQIHSPYIAPRMQDVPPDLQRRLALIAMLNAAQEGGRE